MSNSYVAGGYPEIIISPLSKFWDLSDEDKIKNLVETRDAAINILKRDYGYGRSDSIGETSYYKKTIPKSLRKYIFDRDGYK